MKFGAFSFAILFGVSAVNGDSPSDVVNAVETTFSEFFSSDPIPVTNYQVTFVGCIDDASDQAAMTSLVFEESA